MNIRGVFLAIFAVATSLALPVWADSFNGGTFGSGMQANGTYSVTGKISAPHCPLTASVGTFTPTLAAASCPASSADGSVHFDVPLASGTNVIAFPSNGSQGQAYRLHLYGPASGTPILTVANGYVFPSAELSNGSVPVTGVNAVDIITCTLVPTAAVPNSSSFAQGGLVAECDVGNNYVQ